MPVVSGANIRVLTTGTSVAGVINILAYSPDEWHTVTLDLDFTGDPTGDIESIAVLESGGTGLSWVKLKVCENDTGERCCLRMDDPFIIVGEYQYPPPAVDANGCVVELDGYAYLSLTIDEAYLQQQSPTNQGVTTWTLTGSDLHLLTDYENTGITIFGLDPYRVLGSMDTFEEIPPFVVTADAYIGTAYVTIQGPSAYPYLDPEDKTFALCCLRAEE